MLVKECEMKFSKIRRLKVSRQKGGINGILGADAVGVHQFCPIFNLT
jgi:hypothetical protein